MTRLKTGLFDKLFILHLICTSVLFLIIIVSYYYIEKRSFDDLLIKKAELIHDLLEISCVDPIVNTIAYDRINQSIDALYKENHDIVYIEIYDLTAHIIASVGTSPELHFSIEDINVLIGQNAHSDMSSSIQADGNELITFLETGTQSLGLIRIEFTRKHLQKQLNGSLMYFLGIFILAIALTSLIFNLFTTTWIVSPIGNVSRIMENYGHDELHTVLSDIKEYNQAITQDEIGIMSSSFERMITSIIERKKQKEKAETALAAEKEQLAVTLRSIGDGVITTDISGNIVLLNKVAEELTGWKSEEAVGMPSEEVFYIINEQSRKVCENPITKVISSGRVIGLANHTILIAKNGEERAIADSGAPILDAKSNIIGVVLVFRDVTEKQRLEKEASKARKLESVGILAGGIAHDFNNILAAILGNINLALDYTAPHEPVYTLLSEAEKASLRAKDLTQQLLTFSKGGEPVRKTTLISDIIIDSSTFILSGSNVRCDTWFAPDLLPVDIDSGQMSQVIQNIILNAANAMPQGGVIDIRVDNVVEPEHVPPFLSRGKYIVITVRDHGEGIPENIIDNIFDPYFSTKQAGNGLGLAICHSIIKRHQGYISVVSEPEAGTIFSIYLVASKNQPFDVTDKITGVSVQVSGKIMVMDDDKMVQKVAKAMLIHLGYEIQLAGDGKEAVDLYKKAFSSGTQADLIIMDLTIPGGMGGEDAVKEILAINAEAKIIVSSGYSNDPIMANYEKYGFCGAIVKPYQMQELNTVIQEILLS